MNQNQRHYSSFGSIRDVQDDEIPSDVRYPIEEEGADDRISSLPDEILLCFLSLLPFDFAQHTILLSTRWRGLWNRAYVKHGDKEDIDCAVGDLLLRFDNDNPLRYPRRLQFHFSQGLVLLATIGLKSKLNLDFSEGKQDYFPRQFGWRLVLNSIDPSQQPAYHTTYLVKTLHLKSVSYLTSVIISSLVSNFQCLESLAIEKCKGLRSLRIDVVSNLLNLTVLDCPNLKSLHIEAYELQSLRFRGPLCWFSLHGVFHLPDVMLNFREGPGYNHLEYMHFVSLLRAIRDVEVLTLSAWIFKTIVSPLISSGQEGFRFGKLTDLWWIDSSMEECKIEALVSFLKICPSLKRLFISIDPTSYSAPSTKDECSNQVSTRARLRRLKVVRVEGCIDDEDMIFLKEHLQEVFRVEPITISANLGSQSRCLIRISNQKKKENVNKRAKLQKRKSKFTYKFVEEVEDGIGLFSKHAHMGL